MLKDDHFKCPTTPEEWLSIAQLFEDRWQMPNCIGAADGKHIQILHPKHSGSQFYNYKGFYSIVLMAIVDADYNFIFADVGCQGRISDGGVFRNSSFWKALNNGGLHLPNPSPLPLPLSEVSQDKNRAMPYFLAGDEAFPLDSHIMKPYPQRNLSEEKRVFNYRLSRARRVSENVFGILASRFRVFHSKLCVIPETAVKIVLASIVLHNYLRSKASDAYMRPGRIENQGRTGEATSNPFIAIPNSRKGRQPHDAELMRDELCEYVNGPGQVPWQWKCLL